jgi:quercetin dioxygenase-like cupin family protein
MELKKTNKEVELMKQFIIDNNELEGFYGNGKEIIDIPELPIKHDFADQLYLRQMTMQEGQFVVGAIHNHKHIWFLMKGKITVNDNGEIIDHIAPCYMVSEPGSQRIIYAHEHSIFVNVHKNPSNNKDIKSLEEELVSMTIEEFNQKNN